MIEKDIPAIPLASEDIPFASAAELRQLSVAMAGTARRQLDIASRSLDPKVYDTEEFVEAVKKLALTKRGQIRILVLDPEALLSQGSHRLVELAMRVSSHIEIRKPGPDHQEYNEALLLADRMGVVYRKYSDRHDGQANYHAPLWAARLSDDFEQLWQNAESIPHFRRLML